MDPFLTTYKKHYVRKSAIRPGYRGTTSEFKDPVTEGFKNYLQLSTVEPPAELPIQDADNYLKKHEEKHPRLAKIYFPTPINNDVITSAFIYNGRTVYQIDYCDLEKDQAYKEELRRKNLFKLPDDWDVPLTTHKYTLRNPLIINSRALEPVKQIRVPNNLDPDEPIRKILKVTTGKSEYGGVIGEVGEMIIKEQLHGKIVHSKCTCSEHNPKNQGK